MRVDRATVTRTFDALLPFSVTGCRLARRRADQGPKFAPDLAIATPTRGLSRSVVVVTVTRSRVVPAPLVELAPTAIS
jgi:hypothetical protein